MVVMDCEHVVERGAVLVVWIGCRDLAEAGEENVDVARLCFAYDYELLVSLEEDKVRHLPQL